MATNPPDTHREIFFASDRRVGQGLATFGGLDQTVFTGLETIEDVSADATAMEQLAASTVYQEVARSVVAMEAQAADATAMNKVSASQTARDAIGTSGLAYNEISAVDMAVGKYIAGIAGLTPSNYADIDAVASDGSAMDAVSTSQTARDAIGTSGGAYDGIAAAPTGIGKYIAGIAGLTPSNYADIDAVAADASAMNTVVGTTAAMDALLPSTTAMDSVAASQTAMDKLVASDTATNRVTATTTAIDAIRTAETGGNTYWNSWTFELSSGSSIKRTFDLADHASLEVDWSQTSRYNYQDLYREIIVGGDTLLSISTNPGRLTESVDISGYGDGTTVELNYTVPNSDITEDISVTYSNGESFVQIYDGADTLDIYRVLLS